MFFKKKQQHQARPLYIWTYYVYVENPLTCKHELVLKTRANMKAISLKRQLEKQGKRVFIKKKPTVVPV